MWLPIFFGAAVILLAGVLKISHMRYFLNQTSSGRIVIRDSALRMVNGAGMLGVIDDGQTSHLGTAEGARTGGGALVAFAYRPPRLVTSSDKGD